MTAWTPELHEKIVKETFDKLVSMMLIENTEAAFDSFKAGYEAAFEVGNQVGYNEGYNDAIKSKE